MKIQASVGILTFNSGAVIERALESVKDFDDIVLCDGGSTDETLEIARTYGARVIPQSMEFKNPNGTLKNFGGVRQQTLDAAKHDWFLYIDSDETISEGLREEIREVVGNYTAEKHDGPLVYRVPYGIMMDGRPIRYASNFPGYQYRFFNKKSGAHFIKEVHERISFDTTSAKIGTFKHPWYTYALRANAWNYLRDTRAYRQLQVKDYAQRSFSEYFKNIVIRGLVSSAGAAAKTIRNYLLHGYRDSAPLGDEVGRTLAPLYLLWGVTAARLRRAAPKQILWELFPEYFRRHTFRAIDYPTREAIASRRAEAELFILPELLLRNPAGAFIDIGANVGAYIYVAMGCIPRKQIYAFEPQKEYNKRLRALFSGVHAEQIALSSKSGEAQFKIPEINGTAYPTRGTLESFIEEGENDAEYYTVPLRTFDEYRAEHALSDISVIKIDVEGHERAVLEGMQETLRDLQPALIIEIEQRHHTESIKEIFSFIEQFRYTGWFYNSASHALEPIAHFSIETHQAMNDFKTSRYINNFIFLKTKSIVPEIKSPL